MFDISRFLSNLLTHTRQFSCYSQTREKAWRGLLQRDTRDKDKTKLKSRTLALGTYTKAPKCISRVSRARCLKTRVNPAGSPYFSTLLDMFYTLHDILIVMEIHRVKCKLGNAWRTLNNRLIRFFSVLSLHETSTCFAKLD